MEYIDPTMDAVTAGNAVSMLWPKARGAFEQSWRNLPLLDGGILDRIAESVADMNLDGSLMMILVTSVAFQIFGFLWNLSRVYLSGFIAWPLPSDLGKEACRCRVRYWGWYGALAECASLAGVADLTGKLVAADIKVFVDRGFLPNAFATSTRLIYKILSKVLLEAFPSAWFAISLLALVRNYMGFDVEQWGFTSLSICTSLVVFCISGLDLWTNVYSTIPRRLERCSSEVAIFTFAATVKLLLLLSMLLAWLAFVGAFACPALREGTQQFSIISFNCADFFGTK